MNTYQGELLVFPKLTFGHQDISRHGRNMKEVGELSFILSFCGVINFNGCLTSIRVLNVV